MKVLIQEIVQSRRLFFGCVGLGFLLFVGVLYHFESPLLLDTELSLQNHRERQGRRTPLDPNLVYIGFTKSAYDDVPMVEDEEAWDSPPLLKLREPYPWDRGVYAALAERLLQAGAKVVVLDILLQCG